MTRRLTVLLDGIPMAHLDRAGSGALTLTYTRTDLGWLSPLLPTTTATHRGSSVATFIAGLLPENPATRARWARAHSSPDNDFGLLTRVGRECPGAVQFMVDTDTQAPSGLREISERAVADRIGSLLSDPADWTMPDEHWSLAGAQSKFALRRSAGRWFEALGAAATTHIVKPGIIALAHQALAEHITMDAGRRLGLGMARTEMFENAGEVAVVVERFDRHVVGDEVRRLHQVDLCQALGVLPTRKYEEDGGPTAGNIARLLRRTSTSPHQDVERLRDATIFNQLTGSTDQHAKNFALLNIGSATRLAPLFDVASALAYAPFDTATGHRLAMSIGGEFAIDAVDSHTWRRHFDDIGVDATSGMARVRELALDSVEAFEAAFDHASHIAGAEELKDRLIPALSAHVNATIKRLS